MCSISSLRIVRQPVDVEWKVGEETAVGWFCRTIRSYCVGTKLGTVGQQGTKAGRAVVCGAPPSPVQALAGYHGWETAPAIGP